MFYLLFFNCYFPAASLVTAYTNNETCLQHFKMSPHLTKRNTNLFPHLHSVQMRMRLQIFHNLKNFV